MVAIVRDPARADTLRRPRRSARGRRPRLRGGDPPGRGRRRRASSTSPAATGSASRRRSGRRCTRRTSGRRNGSSTPRSPRASPRIVYISTVNVFGNTKARSLATRRIAATRPTASSATTTRRSSWPTSLPRSGSRPARRSSSSCRGRSTVPAIIRTSGAQLKAAYRRHGTLRRPGRPRHLADPRRRHRRGHRRRAGPRPARRVVRHVRHEHAAARGDGGRGARPAAVAPAARRSRTACSDPGAPRPDRRRGCSACPRTCARSSGPSDGVTYWASHAKATAELGYAPRDLAIGARDAFGPR